jgi:glycosyltransferase involved in cell wall biosynthesis
MTDMLAREGIEAVIIQTHLYPLALRGARFAQKRGLPLIAIEHGSGYVHLGKGLFDAVGHGWEHLFVARLKRCRPVFYTVSKRVSRWLERYDITAKGELYNAIDPDEVRQASAHSLRDFKAEYRVAPDSLVVAFVSRLVPGKGVAKTIDAVKALIERGVPLTLFIAGDGELLEDARRRENERVHVLGRLSHREVLALLGQSDLFCFPTEHPEGFPTVLLEAAASGCFCVSADEGGAGELIRDGESGILLKGGGAEELELALARAAGDDEFRNRAARLAQERALSCFTWEATAQKTQEAFERLSGSDAP